MDISSEQKINKWETENSKKKKQWFCEKRSEKETNKAEAVIKWDI